MRLVLCLLLLCFAAAGAEAAALCGSSGVALQVLGSGGLEVQDKRASTSVVRQLEVFLFKVARARVTLARMSLAFAVQINGFGLALCAAMYSLMADSNSDTLVNTPRRMRLSVMSRKKRSTMLSQEELVGVKCI